jgi:hypothetical protein
VEFAGPNSETLKQITLTVVGNGTCNERQICTYGDERDTCQSGKLPLYCVCIM